MNTATILPLLPPFGLKVEHLEYLDALRDDSTIPCFTDKFKDLPPDTVISIFEYWVNTDRSPAKAGS